MLHALADRLLKDFGNGRSEIDYLTELSVAAERALWAAAKHKGENNEIN